jgi:hypothetical protein
MLVVSERPEITIMTQSCKSYFVTFFEDFLNFHRPMAENHSGFCHSIEIGSTSIAISTPLGTAVSVPIAAIKL